jgi:hypothetical protein
MAVAAGGGVAAGGLGLDVGAAPESELMAMKTSVTNAQPATTGFMVCILPEDVQD